MAVLEAQESSQEPENLGGQVSGAVLSPHPMEEAGEEAVSERRGISRILTVALIGIMVALVLWCIGGLLMKMRILPELDIGYTWFNEHIYPLF